MNDAAHIHLEEEAGAYALGALDDADRAAIDARAAACDECSRRLGDAEADAARLVAPADPPGALGRRVAARFGSRRPPAPWLAIAASFAAGLLIAGLVLGAQLRDASRMQSAATVAMARGHFLHAPFVAVAPGAPPAKALFARDGSWLYVVVAAPRAYEVVAEPGAVPLGTTRVAGDAAALFVNAPPRGATLELRDGSAVVARLRPSLSNP